MFMNKTISVVFLMSFLLMAGCTASHSTNKAEKTGLEIVNFAIDRGQIGESEIVKDFDSFKVKVYVEVGTDLSSVTPNIKISQGASVVPVSGEAID